MAYTSTYMGLTIWDLDSDPYDHNDLVANWEAVDQHDHTPGKGAPLPLEAIPLIPHEHAPDILGECSVDTEQICDDAVTQPKIRQDAVGSSELKTNAVGNTHMKDGAIGTPELQNKSVTEPKLADSAVTSIKIKDDNVTAQKIGQNQIVERHIGTNQVTARHLTTASVWAPQIADGQVGNAELGSNSVSTAKVQDDAITAAKLAPIPTVMTKLWSDQAIAQNTLTRVTWATAQHEGSAMDMWSPSYPDYIYPRWTGLYLVSANIMWYCPYDQNSWRRFDLARFTARIRRNGSNIGGDGPKQGFQDGVGSGSPYVVRHSMNAVVYAAVGNWFDVAVKHVGGAAGKNQVLKPDNLGCNFSVTYLGQVK